MKYTHIISAVLYSLFLIASSCNKDFLNVPPGNVIPRSDYIKDLRTTQEYLNGVYTLLATNLYTSSNYIYPEIIADNIKPLVGSGGLVIHYSWKQMADETQALTASTNNNMNGTSYSAYKVVSACNYILDRVTAYRGENPEKSDDIKGQALVIRALAHYQLVNFFSQSYNFKDNGAHPGIVYLKTFDWTVPITGRISVAQVYDNLINDIEAAIPLFANSNNSTLVVGKKMAIGLLSKIMLGKQDYVSAKNFARDIIDKVPLMNTNYPTKLFTLQETEAIFQLQPNEESYATDFASIYFRAPVLLYAATNDIAKILTEKSTDSRKAWVTQNGSNWNITKFPTGIMPGLTGASGNYYQTILRSSEIYLIAAESYAQMGTSYEDSARYFLDAIRKRADPTVINIVATGKPLLDSIYKERRKELSFEGSRMFDLLRWKMGVNRQDAINPTVQILPYPSDNAIAPIPSLDVKISGVEQNMGY